MAQPDSTKTYQVIIIGGGATGMGIARDCSRRGIKTLLIEKSDIATGATGRNHGLLHSGARYAVTDRESAEECIKENLILKKIASHCVEDTKGLFLSLPEDDIHFQAEFVKACHGSGIDAQIIDTQQALKLEPAANPAIIGAVLVPDGSVDPFRLTMSNMIDAKKYGAEILTYHEVLEILQEQGRVKGIKVYDHKTKETAYYECEILVNAAGIWGQHISELAGTGVRMIPSKGSLLIFGHRINNMVLNRCRKPADADILVPGDTISVIGTTSSTISYDEIDNLRVTPDEVDLLIREGEKLSPILSRSRILRAYAGVRPLVALDNNDGGRNVSRGIVLIDHAERNGLEGFVTIGGGKLVTYRLMAEWTTDLICKKLNISEKCTTADEPLPGSQQDGETTGRKMTAVPHVQREAAIYRHGDRADALSENTNIDNGLVCECEEVSVGEVNYALDNLNVRDLVDLRRRTRVGMGTCQGQLCACRAVGIMAENGKYCLNDLKTDLASFLNERWKGIYPVAWGESLRESEYMSWVYEGVCGMDATTKTETEL